MITGPINNLDELSGGEARELSGNNYCEASTFKSSQIQRGAEL
jgi:hypothetical protein